MVPQLLLAAALAAESDAGGGRFSPGRASSSAQPDVSRAVAMLGFVLESYEEAVGPQRELRSAQELREQRVFASEAAEEVRRRAGPAGRDFWPRFSRLSAQIKMRAPPREVAALARELREELARRFAVRLVPEAPPSAARGRAIYLQACAACHGADGRPALQLSTRTPSFASELDVAGLTPQRIFAAVTWGVPLAAMPEFGEALDAAARWDVAWYILTLPHKGADLARGTAIGRDTLWPSYLERATMSDAMIATSAQRLAPNDRELLIAAIRAAER
jgi:mono/diheme cytochrome c family protein